jgi:ATP-binding cassette subfamily B protein
MLALITDEQTKRLFYRSMAVVVASKGLAIASPWFLKGVVDTMALGVGVNLNIAFLGIGGFAATRLASALLQELRMWDISKIIALASKKISYDAFIHMQKLDIDFHKTSSKNTVFAIARAVRSMESGLRFMLGFATPVIIEFVMLVGMLNFFCGPKYLANMLLTLGLYTYFTKVVASARIQQLTDKKNAEKKSEFYLNESTINYESVKNFGNESLEQSRFRKLLDDLESKSLVI